MDRYTIPDFESKLIELRDRTEFEECVVKLEKHFAGAVKPSMGDPCGPRGHAVYIDKPNEYEYWRRDLCACINDILEGRDDTYVCVPLMSFYGLYEFLKRKAEEER